ncbi:MAG: hypothetical protein ABF292_01830, partial [Desulfobacterales bacterium]
VQFGVLGLGRRFGVAPDNGAVAIAVFAFREGRQAFEKARRDLFENFGIDHVTLQWERSDSFVQCGAACEPKKFNGG